MTASGGGDPLDVRSWLGDIDVYLFDQILKGRFVPGMRILDAGAGNGRNLVYFLRAGFEVFAVDRSDDAIAAVRALAARLGSPCPPENFRPDPVDAMTFDDEIFDGVVSCAVLHFARDRSHFDAMLGEMWRVLRPGGLLFARLASSIGIESLVRPLGEGRFRLPDGSDRYLVDESMLIATTDRLGGDLVEPIKTVNVQRQRCMTNWCLRKH